MPDVVFMLPTPNGWAALDADQLAAALARGAKLAATPSSDTTTTADTAAQTTLLDARQLQTLTGVPASWWMTQAREHRVPHVRIGRRVRFNAAEVMTSDALRRRAIPDGGLAGRVTGSPDRKAQKK